MARDLLREMSLSQLKRQIAGSVDGSSAFTAKAQIFSKIVHLRGYDALPELVCSTELNGLLENTKALELQRGIKPSPSISAEIYAGILVSGPMFPGVQIALGHGIYFAEPSGPAVADHFPKSSITAQHYATTGSEHASGVVLRCALRAEAWTIEKLDLQERFRDDRNRAKAAGIVEMGAYAAAIGFDAIWSDGVHLWSGERVWNVVNRAALTFQKEALRVAHDGLTSCGYGTATRSHQSSD